jgi:hypothetical protein
MPSRWPGVATLVVVVTLGIGCQREPAVEKSLLVELPKSYVEKSFVLSEDAEAWAFVTETDAGQRVVSSAGTGELHAFCTKLAFAPKTHRLFYWARDGSEEEPTISLVADGTRVATDFVTIGEMGFSHDGARWLAASGARGPSAAELGEITLFVDGVVTARAKDMALPSFSRDGRHLAYLTSDEKRGSLFVDGELKQTFDLPTGQCGVAALHDAPRPDLPMRHVVQYLADGSLLVVTRDPDGWGVYRDGERIAYYVRTTFDAGQGECGKMSAFAPRSMRIAAEAPVAYWWARDSGDANVWRVVRNGQPVDDVACIEPWRHHPPETSADGTQVVYACAGEENAGDRVVHLVKDGTRWGPYDDVWGIAPSENFAHVAYGASYGPIPRPWSIYVDGVARVSNLLANWRPKVWNDGSTVAWEALLTDGGRGRFGIDDHHLGSFDEVYWGPEAEPHDRVGWVVRRGRKITRISVPLSYVRTPADQPRAVRRVDAR